MKEELKQRRKPTSDINDVVIPFHGPKVTYDDIIQSLKKPFNHKQEQTKLAYFISISHQMYAAFYF